MVVEDRKNSVIFKDIYSDNMLSDFNLFGTVNQDLSDRRIIINEENHCLTVGDAIYFNFKTKEYRRALANNTPMAEVIGVVSQIIDNDNFELALKGDIILDRYDNIPEGSILYLSSNIVGRLVQDEPYDVTKIIGIKIKDGIKVDIQRGYHTQFSEKVALHDYNNKYVFENNDKMVILNYNIEPNEVNCGTRNYTQEELQEIITRVKNDIY